MKGFKKNRNNEWVSKTPHLDHQVKLRIQAMLDRILPEQPKRSRRRGNSL